MRQTWAGFRGVKNDVKGEGSRLPRKKKVGGYSQHQGRKRRKQLRELVGQPLGRGRAGPSRPRPRVGPAHRPAARRRRQGSLRAAGARAGLSAPPLAAPPAERCRRQNQTRPSRPRPSPRAGAATGRRAAGAMVRAWAAFPGPLPPRGPAA